MELSKAALLLLIQLLRSCGAGQFKNCQSFVEVPESSQDKNPSSVNDLTKRPLGYNSSTLLYDDPTPPPCAKVSGLTGSQPQVEVMVETITPNAKMCVESNAAGSQPVCGEGQVRFCRPAAAADISYEFDCSGEGCETVDVQFWYRITKGDPDDEHWCMSRSGGDYPSSLVVPPGPITPRPSDGNRHPSSSSTRLSHAFWTTAVGLTVFLVNTS